MSVKSIKGVSWMATEDPGNSVTRLLNQARGGNRAAGDEVYRILYSELHTLATKRMKRQPRDHTLQATALVSEACCRLLKGEVLEYQSRDHFMATAATAMRSVLVDYARARAAGKRSPHGEEVSLEYIVDGYSRSAFDLLALHHALERLAEIDPQAARIVEMRFFGGYSHADIARILGVSTRTVERDWASARARLLGEIK